MNKFDIRLKINMRTTYYILLGLYETANIIDFESTEFWQDKICSLFNISK